MFATVRRNDVDGRCECGIRGLTPAVYHGRA